MKTLIQFVNEQLSKPNAFCLLKPGFIHHHDEFLDVLKLHGWNIVKDAEIQLDNDKAQNLYSSHKDKDFYNDLCDYMVSSPCHWYACYKKCNDPVGDMKRLKDEIRSKWGKDDMHNCMHSSDSQDNVRREIMICDCQK